MGHNLEELKRKIEGTQKLFGVVRTMKALAASQIHQYEMAVNALESYSYSLKMGLWVCQRDRETSQSIHPTENENQRLCIVLGSDQSLVGALNDTMNRFVFKNLQKEDKKNHFFVLGEKLLPYFDSLQMKLFHLPQDPSSLVYFIEELLVSVELFFEANPFASLDVFYHHPDLKEIYKPTLIHLLPLEDSILNFVSSMNWPTNQRPEALGDNEKTWHTFRREYLFVMLYRACMYSLASENSSRLATMMRAEKNIEEVLDVLSRTHHQLRQEAIDSELFDVLAGGSVLSS